jgi:hypothetical protein
MLTPWLLASFVVAWTFAAPIPAAPEPAPANQAVPVDDDAPPLVWEAAPPCPDLAFVRARIEALIGRPLADSGEPVHAVAVVDVGAPRPRVHLRVRSETGIRDRTIEDDDCAALAEITAVVVAIAIDPSASLREPEPIAPPPAPAPAPAPPVATRPVVPAEPKLQGLVRAAVGVGWGAVPGIAPTLGLVAGLRWPHARLELGAEHWFMQQARFDRATSIGVDVRLTSAVLHGCWVPSVKRVEFPLCAGAAVGSLRGDGVGVPRGARKRLVWSAGHVAAAVLFAPIRALAFGLDARLVVPFSRNRFTLDDYGVIHRTSVAGVVVSAVIEGRFP